jgi:hypothetical protein
MLHSERTITSHKHLRQREEKKAPHKIQQIGVSPIIYHLNAGQNRRQLVPDDRLLFHPNVHLAPVTESADRHPTRSAAHDGDFCR